MDSATDALLTWMDAHAGELYKLLRDYLAVRSENFITRGDEKPCAELVQRHWRELGLDARLYAPTGVPGLREHEAFLEGRDAQNRPNVTAVWPGGGAGNRLMLLAHTDTMPVGDPAMWTVDPLGEMKDGRIYGRGANDDKCGLAAITFLLRALRERGIELERGFAVNAYADEEYGGGNGALAAALDCPCDAYINLDGGNFEIWTVALGGIALQFDVVSREILDSSHTIVQALGMLQEELLRFGARRREELGRNPVYAGTDIQRSAFRITGCRAGEFGTDLNAGYLQCSVYTDSSREAVDAELEDVLAAARARTEPLGVTIYRKPLSRYFHYGRTQDSMGLVPSLQQAVKRATGREPVAAGSCLTDLNLLLQYGSPNSLNFGLVRDFKLYGGAHQPDEFVECADLLAFAKSLALLVLDQCGAKALRG